PSQKIGNLWTHVLILRLCATFSSSCPFVVKALFRCNLAFTSPFFADMLPQPSTAAMQGELMATAPLRASAPTHYAGFWIRFVAALIDGILVGCANAIIGTF